MRDLERAGLLNLWHQADEAHDGWAKPLTLSLAPTGALSLLLCRTLSHGGAFQILGASAGAPIVFIDLCRQFGAGIWMGGAQHRFVAGVGCIAWSAVSTGNANVVLFGLYERAFDRGDLNELARITESCVLRRGGGGPPFSMYWQSGT